MPHLTIEYSANLDVDVDMGKLCATLSRAMLDSGLFEPGAIRVRALRAEAYAVGDQLPPNGFVDMSLRMGAGRGHKEKKSAGDAIFAAASTFFAERLAAPHFALSLEIREIDPELSWKKNSMHPRLRGDD
jgi:5-carboxymethyl-2-hydroxymuconate isomerase